MKGILQHNDKLSNLPPQESLLNNQNLSPKKNRNFNVSSHNKIVVEQLNSDQDAESNSGKLPINETVKSTFDLINESKRFTLSKDEISNKLSTYNESSQQDHNKISNIEIINQYNNAVKVLGKSKISKEYIANQNFSFAPVCSQINLEADIPKNEMFEQISPISTNNVSNNKIGKSITKVENAFLTNADINTHNYEVNAHKVCINIVRNTQDCSYTARYNTKEDNQVLCSIPIVSINEDRKFGKHQSESAFKESSSIKDKYNEKQETKSNFLKKRSKLKYDPVESIQNEMTSKSKMIQSKSE